MGVKKYVCHSRRVWRLAKHHGWRPGARYTNLRDVRDAERLGFLDIDWRNYKFKQHLSAAKATRPELTVARDVTNVEMLDEILDQATILSEYSDEVIIVPKDCRIKDVLSEIVPSSFLLGFSVPTRYGGTQIHPSAFSGRRVHLLGGRPDIQRKLGEKLNVVSVDTNRFTLDAAYGDFFDGEIFRPHPEGGYERCINDSLKNINKLWENYCGPSKESEKLEVGHG